MAPPKKEAVSIIKKVKDSTEFELKTSAEYPKVCIMDYHLDWCGPCTVIEPNFATIFFNIYNAEQRLEFLTVSESILPEGSVE